MESNTNPGARVPRAPPQRGSRRSHTAAAAATIAAAPRLAGDVSPASNSHKMNTSAAVAIHS